jgi:hypothetical protein
MLAKLQIGGWKIDSRVDDDGHLNVWISHSDGTEVIPCDAELCSDLEWGERFTTVKIEEDYKNAN